MKEKIITKVDGLNIFEKGIVWCITGICSWSVIVYLLLKLFIKSLIYILLMITKELFDLLIFIFYMNKEAEKKEMYSKSKVFFESICKHMETEVIEEKS